MKHYRSLIVVALVACLALLLTVGLAQAQTGVSPNGPTGGGGPGDVSSGFTYQGQLKNASGPVNGTCDFVFSLWDQSGTGVPPTGGLQIGSTITQTAVSVTNGLFTVILNASGEFGSEAFNGQARWLGITVRCPAGSGAYTVLSPRQPLWAAPYAMSLRPGAMISGSVSGATLAGVNTNSGLFTAGVGGQSTSGIGAGVYGQNVASTGYAYGVFGESVSTGGRGVYGRATAASGTTYGMKGYSASPDGYGVYGSNGSDPAVGNGAGVYGSTTSSDGAGVWGETSSPVGYGVYGHNTATAAQAYGVFGRSESIYGIGVRGESNHIGVEGKTSDGVGVMGWAQTGDGIGVMGHSWADNGIGVYGSSDGIGVEAHSSHGIALAATGSGVISSTADTALYLSPFTAMRRDSFSDLTFTPLDNGGVRIKKVGTAIGERLVVIPISTAGVVFGAPVYVKSVEVCYKTSATVGYITGSGAYKGNGETYAAYLSSATDYSSTTRACYTINASTRAVIDNSSYVQLHLYFTNSTEPEITIFTVKVNLSELSQ